MATYGDMQTRIADELDRGDLTAQIKKAILSAIAFYERKKFYFTESSGTTFSTVIGQEFYGSSDLAAIATSPMIDVLRGNYVGLRVDLTKRAWEYIDDISVLTTSKARPMDWAYRAQQIRLYPIPDAVYTMTIVHLPRLAALSADGDSNAWTNDAEELIRSRAKVDVMRNVIRGPEMAEEVIALTMQEKQALAMLYAENASRKAVGYAIPTQF